jgi:dynamin GTPase
MLLKAENMVDKTEWVSKISNIIQPSKGPPTKGPSSSDTSAPMRSSLSDGSLVSCFPFLFPGTFWGMF